MILDEQSRCVNGPRLGGAHQLPIFGMREIFDIVARKGNIVGKNFVHHNFTQLPRVSSEVPLNPPNIFNGADDLVAVGFVGGDSNHGWVFAERLQHQQHLNILGLSFARVLEYCLIHL